MVDTSKFPACIVLSSLLMAVLCSHCHAQNWSNIIRKAANVAEDVPVNKADEFAKNLAENKSFKDSLVRRFKDANPKKTPTASRFGRQLDELIQNIDPDSARAIRSLDESAQPVAIVLLDGAKKTEQLIPDLAMRGRFIRDGGPETIAAIGLHGDDAARQLRIFDGQLAAGKIIAPAGQRAANLQDLGRFLSNGGDNAWKFWRESVVPHLGKWLAGGAISAFLIAPDLFIDSAGNLTKYGTEKVLELGGEVLANALKGVAAGSKKAGNEITKVFWQDYLTSWNAIYAWCGLGAVLAIGIPRTRQGIIGLIRKLLGSKKT